MRGRAIIIGLALLLAGCAAESEETTTSAAADTTTTTAPATTTTTEPTTTTEQTTTTTSGEAAGGGESCVVGTWELDSEAFMESLEEAFADEAALDNATVEFVEGSYTVTMTGEGSFTALRDGWSFQVVSPEGTFRLTIDGSEEGGWTTDGSTLTVTNMEGSLSVDAQAVVDGELVDLPTGSLPTIESSAVAESSTYECSGDSLTVTVEEGFVSEFTRAES